MDLPKEYMALDLEVLRGDSWIELRIWLLSLLMGILLFLVDLIIKKAGLLYSVFKGDG